MTLPENGSPSARKSDTAADEDPVATGTDTAEYTYEYVEVEETEESLQPAKEEPESSMVKSSKPVRPVKPANASADVLDNGSPPASKEPKLQKYTNKIKLPSSKHKSSAQGNDQAPQKRVKSKERALSKSSGDKSVKSKVATLKKSPKPKPIANSSRFVKSKPMSVKSSKDWTAPISSKVSSRVGRVKSCGKSSQKGKSLQMKSKGGALRSVKSKPISKLTEKSSGQSSHDAAVELIKQIISEMQAKSSSGKLVSSSSAASRASSSGGSMVAASSSSGTRSSQAESSGKSRPGKVKASQAKNKTRKSTPKGKSSFSSRVSSNKESKTKEQKRVMAKSRANSASSTASSQSNEPAKSAAKVEPVELSKVQALTQQMKMDPKMAKALEKYWPELVSAFKQQQQTQPGKEEGKVAAASPEKMTNDEMEDLNDELTDLNTSINTLRHSYGSIIRSLVNMQRRREKKKAALAPVPNAPTDGTEAQAPDGSPSGPPTTIDDICGRTTINYATKYNMDRFLDSNSRDGVFQELFREVNEINCAMVPFKKFFNAEGYFQAKDYQEQNELQFSRMQYGDCLKVIKDLSKVVTTILKAYNTDLLDMFRIT